MWHQGDQVAFHIGNYVFTFLFVVELVIRVAAQGCYAKGGYGLRVTFGPHQTIKMAVKNGWKIGTLAPSGSL